MSKCNTNSLTWRNRKKISVYMEGKKDTHAEITQMLCLSNTFFKVANSPRNKGKHSWNKWKVKNISNKIEDLKKKRREF